MRRNRLIILPAVLLVLFSITYRGSFAYDGVKPEGTCIRVGHSLDKEILKIFKEFAAEFNETNDYGIEVEFSGTVGDMIIAPEQEITSLVEMDESRVIELAALARHPLWGLGRDRRPFYGSLGRQINSIPLLTDAEIIIYNKTMLEAAGKKKFPASWFSLNRLMDDLFSGSGKPAMGINLQADSVISIVNARGGSVIRPLGKSYSFNNPVVVRAIRYLGKKNETGMISFEDTAYSNQTEFAFGDLFSVFTGSEGIKYYDELISVTNPEMEWGVAPLPSRRPGTGLTVGLSSCGAVFRGEAEKELASWIFIKWLSDVPQQVRLSAATGSLPAARRAAEAVAELPGAVHQWKEAVEIYNSGFKNKMPGLADYIIVKEQFNDIIHKCLENGWIWLELQKFNYEVINTQ